MIMTEEEKDITDEELEKRLQPIAARIRASMQRYMKETRNEFLQEPQEDLKELAAEGDNMPSDGWWEHISEDDKTRHCLTGLYKTPPIHSQVVICKDHPFLEAWMKEEGAFGVVLSVEPPSIITLRDKKDNLILDKNNQEVRMPGIPRVEVDFSEDDYGRGFYLPADCVKLREDDDEVA